MTAQESPAAQVPRSAALRAAPVIPGTAVAVVEADQHHHVFAEPLAVAGGRGRSRRRSALFAVAVAALFVVLVVRFRGDAASRLSGVPAPRWHWLAACAGCTVVFYIANGLSMRAASGLRLELRTVTGVQVAAAATNRIVPAGLGAIAIHLRYLQKQGMTRPAALAAIASIKGAGAVSHLLGLVIVAGTLSGTGIGAAVISPVRSTIHDVGAGPCVIVCVIVAAAVTGTVAHPRVRAVARPAVRVFRGHLSVLAHSPGRATMLLLSQAATRLTQILALACTVWAFGGDVTFMSVATVYLVGSMVAGAAPTAGGVGALEPALAFGLAAAGGTAAVMLAAVLVYRVITFWLPVIPGVVALAGLRRSGNL
nr:YbhN family protein [Frankia canadensis]